MVAELTERHRIVMASISPASKRRATSELLRQAPPTGEVEDVTGKAGDEVTTGEEITGKVAMNCVCCELHLRCCLRVCSI